VQNTACLRDTRAFSFSAQLEKLTKLKDGAYLKYVFSLHLSLFFFPSQAAVKTSCSSVKMISVKVTHVSILDALSPNTPAFSIFAETADE